MRRADSPPESALVGLRASSPREQHLAEQAAQFLLRGLRIELVQPLDGGHAVGDGIGVVLREIADGDFVAPHDDAAIEREIAVGIVDVAGGVADQRFQQSGLAGAVASHQRDLLAA